MSRRLGRGLCIKLRRRARLLRPRLRKPELLECVPLPGVRFQVNRFSSVVRRVHLEVWVPRVLRYVPANGVPCIPLGPLPPGLVQLESDQGSRLPDRFAPAAVLERPPAVLDSVMCRAA